MYLHRLSVLISFLHSHASTLTRLQLHHLARSQDRASLGTYGCLHSAPLAEYCIPASAPFCTNLLDPPKHWRGLLPYWLMSGSLFPQTGPQTLARGFWRQADARTFQHHVDLSLASAGKEPSLAPHARHCTTWTKEESQLSARYEPFVRAR
jgi:hypothetical protein